MRSLIKHQTITIPVIADCDDTLKDRLGELANDLTAPELAYAIQFLATELERR